MNNFYIESNMCTFSAVNNRKKTRKCITLVKSVLYTLLFFISSILHAQKVSLSLEECVRLAHENGPASEIARSAYVSRFHRYESFHSGLLPQLSLQGTLPNIERAINSITQPDGSLLFRSQSQAQSSANLTVSQQIPFTGGEIFLSSGLSRIDLLGDNPTKLWSVSPFVFGLRQPIFQLNNTAWNTREQNLSYDIAKKQYTEAMEDIALDAVARFFDVYLAQMNVENARLNVMINDSTYQLSQGRFNVGKIAENELLQNELSSLNAKMSLSTAQIDLLNARQSLAIVLGMPNNQLPEVLPPDKIPSVSADSALALDAAVRNRSDVRAIELQTVTATRSKIQTELNNGFNATLSATLGLNQTAPTVPNALDNLLDRQTFSLNVSMPLFQWGRSSHENESAIAEERRAISSGNLQLLNFKQEITNHVQRMGLLEKQVSIAKKSEEIAHKRYDMTKNRYLIGKIDVKDLLFAQSEKDAALRTFTQTIRDFWTGYYRLRRLTLYDFVKRADIEYGKAPE